MLRTALSTLALALLAPTLPAQDFHFISSRDSGPNQNCFEIYRYQNGATTRRPGRSCSSTATSVATSRSTAAI
jgi:hypothetical protein